MPFGTFLGQQLGWRSTFWAISAIGVVAGIGIAALVPASRGVEAPVGIRRELAAFRSGQVWLSLTVTALAFGGMFGAFTYIAYTLTEVAGFAAATVPWLLVLFGVGLVIGNGLGGRLADRSIDGTLLFFISALVIVLTLFALFAGSAVATIVALFLMGGFGFGTVPALQSRVMHYPAPRPPSPPAPTSAPSTSATPSAHGAAAPASPRASATRPRSGSALSSPRRHWS